MNEDTVFATIPGPVIAALKTTLGFGSFVALAETQVDEAIARGNQRRVEAIEKSIAAMAHTYAHESFIALVNDMDEAAAVTALMDLAIMRAGDPYGAHRVWLDRGDIAAELKVTVIYASELTRRGLFDTVTYGSNPTARGTKRWASAESVTRYRDLQSQGLSQGEILARIETTRRGTVIPAV